MSKKNKLFLFPGLAADERLFDFQKIAFDNLVTPKWLTPLPDESLSNYAKRWSSSLDFNEGDHLGGMSFGGQVALELAKHLPAKSVFMISANRRASEISSSFHQQEKFLNKTPETILKLGLKTLGIPKFTKHENISETAIQKLYDMVDDLDAKFLKWAAKAIVKWDYEFCESDFSMPIYQIHGKKDPIIHISKPEEVQWIAEGRHLINFSHYQEINKWLQEKMQNAS